MPSRGVVQGGTLVDCRKGVRTCQATTRRAASPLTSADALLYALHSLRPVGRSAHRRTASAASIVARRPREDAIPVATRRSPPTLRGVCPLDGVAATATVAGARKGGDHRPRRKHSTPGMLAFGTGHPWRPTRRG